MTDARGRDSIACLRNGPGWQFNQAPRFSAGGYGISGAYSEVGGPCGLTSDRGSLLRYVIKRLKSVSRAGDNALSPRVVTE
jgi:hypothetical protein